MSAVVLRCPSCGTTQGSLGECGACHEASVRYFCTNHSPGRWLDAASCSTCGARWGESTRPAPPPAERRPPMPAPRRPAVSRPPPPHLRPVPSDVPRDVPRAARRHAIPTEAREEAFDLGAPSLAPWQRVLGAVLRARALARSTADDGARIPMRRSSAGGCFRRLLLMVVFAFFALVVAVVLFGRALMHQL